jgi:hypothetical protein
MADQLDDVAVAVDAIVVAEMVLLVFMALFIPKTHLGVNLFFCRFALFHLNPAERLIVNAIDRFANRSRGKKSEQLNGR